MLWPTNRAQVGLPRAMHSRAMDCARSFKMYRSGWSQNRIGHSVELCAALNEREFFNEDNFFTGGGPPGEKCGLAAGRSQAMHLLVKNPIGGRPGGCFGRARLSFSAASPSRYATGREFPQRSRLATSSSG